MSSPITQRVKTAYKQSTEKKNNAVVNEKDNIVFKDDAPEVNLQNKAAEVAENLSTTNLADHEATLIDLGPDFKPTQAQTDAANAKVAELKALDEKNAATNLANEQNQNQGGDGDGDGDGGETNAYLSEKRKTVHKRDAAGNIKRTKNMQARDDERTMKGDYRDIKQMGRQSWRDLDKATKQEYKAAGMTRGDWVRKGGQFQDFSSGADGKPGSFADTDESTFAGNMRVNRKHGGSISDMMNKYGGSSDANRQDFNVASDGRREYGASEQISGNVGDELPATIENRERYKKEYGYYPEDSPNDQNSGFKQTGFSGFQQNPTSPKKVKMPKAVGNLYEGFKKKIGGFIDGFKKGPDAEVKPKPDADVKVKDVEVENPRNLPAVQENKLPSNKVKTDGPNTRNNFVEIEDAVIVPNRPKWKTPLYTGAGILTGGIGVSLMSSSGSNQETSETDTDPKPEEKKLSKYGTKTWEQGYKDWGGEKKGTMDQFKSEANAWWDSDAGQKHAKDKGYKHRIKKEKVTPVNETSAKPLEVTAKNTVEVNTGTDIENITEGLKTRPTTPTTTKTKKQTKAENKISRLEDRKSTPKRDIRIQKQKDKAAGLSRDVVKKNKIKNKEAAVNPAGINTGNKRADKIANKALYASEKGDTKTVNRLTNKLKRKGITVTSLENKKAELQKAAGFKQKGWAGYQK